MDEFILSWTYLTGSHNDGIQGPTEEFTRHNDLQTSHDRHFLGRGIGGSASETRTWSEGGG